MYFNPLFKQFKSQTGAVDCSKPVTLRVKGNFDSVVLQLRKDGENFFRPFIMQKEGEFFTVQVSAQRGLYFYCFNIGNGKFLGKGDGFEAVISQNPIEYQLTVYDNDYTTPEWFKGGIIYQIFPDRFCKGVKNKTIEEGKILREDWGGTPTYLPNEKGEVLNNDFFGGDFKGITKKLKYIASLGVTVIYLNPIFKAYSNHRYDTGDFLSFDPLLGTEKDFLNLVDKANQLGIKIILDGVFNHTGSDSVYFNKDNHYDCLGAYQSQQSPYYDWFDFIRYPNEYNSWWGIKTLPSTNKDKGGFIDFICGRKGVLEKYTKMGIGGWRLDVVDELPAHFVRKIRSSVKKINKNAILIGEVWEDASNKISYGVRREYFQGKELDSVMNYPLKNAILDYVCNGNVEGLDNVINEQIDHYPSFVLNCLMNILSTHDTFRLLSAVSGLDYHGKPKSQLENLHLSEKALEKAKFKVKCASLLQYFLCGVPSLYYGEEVGMQGFSDPLNRRCYPWGNEDKELLDWFITLGKIRREYSAFKEGEYQRIYAKNGTLIFKRVDKDCEVLVAINLGDKEIDLRYEGVLVNLFDNSKFYNKVTLTKQSFGVFVNIEKSV